MADTFREALATYRPGLLRHCYRMLGSFDDAEDLVQETLAKAWKGRSTFAAKGPLRHWLYRIATHACLNALKHRRRVGLPHRDRDPSPAGSALDTPLEPVAWITPAPDDRLFASGPAEVTETRESVALAFIALLQRLPPRQRAVLLLKDVVGWPAEEIAEALGLSLPAVNSALHRARSSMPADVSGLSSPEEPPAKLVREYIRCWEARDLPALLKLMRDDIVFDMPPWRTWFRGPRAVELFLTSPRFVAFHSAGLRLISTRANGQLALAFYRRSPEGGYLRRSLQLPRFERGKLSAVTTFVGPTYLKSFQIPERIPETERFRAPRLS